MADVFGVERPIEPPAEDPADSTDAPDVRDGLFDGRAGGDQGMDAASHLLGMHVQVQRPLSADEHAAVETLQRDPLGLAFRPPERLEPPSRPPKGAIMQVPP